MTEPRDPNERPSAQPGPNGSPQEPMSGPVVSYNASAFEEDDEEPTGAAEQSAPAGEFGAPTSDPRSGPTAAPPQSGAFGMPQGPPSGGFGAASGTYSQPVTGGTPYNAPAAGATQYNAPATGTTPYGGPSTGAMPYGAPAMGSTPYAPYPEPVPAQAGFSAVPQTAPPARIPHRSRKPIYFSLGALVLVGALIAAYFVFFTFGGIQNSRGKIANAKGFADQAAVAWKDSLPDEGITVGKSAGCYYIIDDDDEITNQLACGPALRAGADKGDVWDVYGFTVTGSKDKQKAQELTETPKLSQPAPTKGSIVDVKGAAPADDGKDLKEPEMPKASADTVWTAEQFTVEKGAKGTAVELDADPRLVAPGVQVVVSSITQYGIVVIDGQPKQAPDGQKLYVIALNGDAGSITGTLASTLDVDLNGTKAEVSGDPASLGDAQFLVSVPTSGTSTLVLDTEGHQQTINLADGKRAADATTELYYTGTPEPSVSLSAAVTFPIAQISETEQFGLDITLTQAYMTPYTDDLGWAPADQQWLVIEMDTAGKTSLGSDSVYKYYSIDCAASTVSDGATKSCLSDAGSSQTATWIAAVTPGVKSFALSITASMKAWSDGSEEISASFGPAPASVAFP